MSTAIASGSAGTVRAIARVLVVTAAGGELADRITRLGHELLEPSSADGAAQAGPDIAFVDSQLLEGTRLRDDVPLVAISENPTAVSTGRCLAVMTPAQAAVSCQALVELALQLNLALSRAASFEARFGGLQDGSALVGRSPVIRRLQSAVSRAADSDATVLIEGPTGSGKSLAARLVHCKSRRGGRAMLVLDCEHVDAARFGEALEQARGTTLLLEDIERLPAGAQQILVRFLKERTTPPPSAPQPARIIATTRAHLPEHVARGAFREDLYYRLHNYPLVMPALRERVDDIALLAEAVLDQCASEGNGRVTGFTPAALILLESMAWPNNVAQLETIVRRAFVAAHGGLIDREHLLGSAPSPANAAGQSPEQTSGPAAERELTEEDIRPFDEEEQHLLGRALRATKGNVRRAAQLLGIGRATLYRKIQQYRLRLQ